VLGAIASTTSAGGVEEGLRRAADWSVENWKLRGVQARGVVLDTYTPAAVGPQNVSMYQ